MNATAPLNEREPSAVGAIIGVAAVGLPLAALLVVCLVLAIVAAIALLSSAGSALPPIAGLPSSSLRRWRVLVWWIREVFAFCSMASTVTVVVLSTIEAFLYINLEDNSVGADPNLAGDVVGWMLTLDAIKSFVEFWPDTMDGCHVLQALIKLVAFCAIAAGQAAWLFAVMQASDDGTYFSSLDELEDPSMGVGRIAGFLFSLNLIGAVIEAASILIELLALPLTSRGGLVDKLLHSSKREQFDDAGEERKALLKEEMLSLFWVSEDACRTSCCGRCKETALEFPKAVKEFPFPLLLPTHTLCFVFRWHLWGGPTTKRYCGTVDEDGGTCKHFGLNSLKLAWNDAGRCYDPERCLSGASVFVKFFLCIVSSVVFLFPIYTFSNMSDAWVQVPGGFDSTLNASAALAPSARGFESYFVKLANDDLEDRDVLASESFAYLIVSVVLVQSLVLALIDSTTNSDLDVVCFGIPLGVRARLCRRPSNDDDSGSEENEKDTGYQTTSFRHKHRNCGCETPGARALWGTQWQVLTNFVLYAVVAALALTFIEDTNAGRGLPAQNATCVANLTWTIDRDIASGKLVIPGNADQLKAVYKKEAALFGCRLLKCEPCEGADGSKLSMKCNALAPALSQCKTASYYRNLKYYDGGTTDEREVTANAIRQCEAAHAQDDFYNVRCVYYEAVFQTCRLSHCEKPHEVPAAGATATPTPAPIKYPPDPPGKRPMIVKALQGNGFQEAAATISILTCCALLLLFLVAVFSHACNSFCHTCHRDWVRVRTRERIEDAEDLVTASGFDVFKRALEEDIGRLDAMEALYDTVERSAMRELYDDENHWVHPPRTWRSAWCCWGLRINELIATQRELERVQKADPRVDAEIRTGERVAPVAPAIELVATRIETQNPVAPHA